MNAKSLKVFIAMVLCAGMAAPLLAQEAKKKDKPEPVVDSKVKEVQGEISYIAKRSISLVLTRDKEKGVEEEILLPLDENVIFEHKRNLSGFHTGDTVFVRYLDETIDYGDRKENTIKAKVIRFLQPAAFDSPYKPRAAAPADEEEGLLPLKGAK